VWLTGMGLVRREVSEGVVRQEGWVHSRGGEPRRFGAPLETGSRSVMSGKRDKVNRKVTAPRWLEPGRRWCDAASFGAPRGADWTR
jgi:hypothetical protein